DRPPGSKKSPRKKQPARRAEGFVEAWPVTRRRVERRVTAPPSPVHHRRAEAFAVAILLLPLVLAVPALIAGWAWSPAANLYTSYPWQGLAPAAGPANPALGDAPQWFHPALLWGRA